MQDRSVSREISQASATEKLVSRSRVAGRIGFLLKDWFLENTEIASYFQFDSTKNPQRHGAVYGLHAEPDLEQPMVILMQKSRGFDVPFLVLEILESKKDLGDGEALATVKGVWRITEEDGENPVFSWSVRDRTENLASPMAAALTFLRADLQHRVLETFPTEIRANERARRRDLKNG